jgi:hypothetical protein
LSCFCAFFIFSFSIILPSSRLHASTPPSTHQPSKNKHIISINAIFNSTALLSVSLPDARLILMVGMAVLVDVLVLMWWQLTDPLRAVGVLISSDNSRSEGQRDRERAKQRAEISMLKISLSVCDFVEKNNFFLNQCDKAPHSIIIMS